MFNKENTYVINLEKRQDRLNSITYELNKHNIEFQVFKAIQDINGTMGCLLSHLQLIKLAKENNLPYIFIMEDDCFYKNFKFSSPPNDWKMLFFGGVVNKVYNNDNYEWKRVSNWYAHSYVIHEDIYDLCIEQIEKNKGKKAVDEIYCEDIHPKIQSYMHYPLLSYQKEDYSDIEKRDIDRRAKIETFHDIVEKLNPNPTYFKYIYCINLNNRPDKKEFMEKQFFKYNLKVKFFYAQLHQNPVQGCKESHINILRQAYTLNLPYVVILEDDAEFKYNPNILAPPPENWDMLYIGGNYVDIEQHTQEWFKCKSWSTYGYIVSNHMFMKLADDLEKTNKEIDRFYLENIHPNYNVYMHNPRLVVPAKHLSNSDIEKKEMDYSFLQNPWIKNDNRELKNEKSSEEIWNNLNKNNLPKISIVTPTFGRPEFFYLSLYNIKNSTYPKDKIQWIIIDEGENTVKNMVPKDDFIEYYYISKEKRLEYYKNMCDNLIKRSNGNNVTKSQSKTRLAKKLYKVHNKGDFLFNRLPIGLKRNIGCALAKNEIIVFMDDDDYYPANSIMKRVLLLQYYQKFGKELVYCSTIPNFNLINMVSMMNMPPTDLPFYKRVSEASLTFTKTFWNQNKFNSQAFSSEAEGLMKGFEEKCQEIQWNEIIVALVHNRNNSIRSSYTDEPNGWHFGKIDDNVFSYLISLVSNQCHSKQ